MSYDDWKTRAPDPGTSDGKRPRKLGRCLTCRDFKGDASETVHHANDTGHTVTWRGVPQQERHQ